MKEIDAKTGLKIYHKKQIISIFRENSKVEQVWLFGSRATGTFKAHSDIDLVIKGKHLTLTDLAILVDKLESTSIPYKMDVLIKEQITNLALLEQIEQHGIRWL